MTSDADLPKLPLELLYREMINRYLLLSPSKVEYGMFMDSIMMAEKAFAKDKPLLRTRFIEICKCLTPTDDDRKLSGVLNEWDD